MALRTLAVIFFAVLISTTAHADKEVQILAAVNAVVLMTAIGTPVAAQSDHLAFDVGRFDPVKKVQPTTAFGAQFRFGQPLLWRLQPFVGAGFTGDHSFYGYGGIRVPVPWGDHVIATPSFAIGGYSRVNGKDLGTPAVIGRFGLDLEYRFDTDVRVGLGYHHVSNGKVLGQDINPGTEVVGLTLSIPVR